MAQGNRTYLDGLLALDGDRYFIDADGRFEVIFRVSRVPVSRGRPHGLKYSLVMMNAGGERVVGFDNAHAVKLGPGASKQLSLAHDHKHLGDKVEVYKFMDAYTLLKDFWAEVDRFMGSNLGEEVQM